MSDDAATRAAEGYVDIVFDGPPSHESGRFVEVENAQGRSINFGEWVHRADGYWALRIHREHATPAQVEGRMSDERYREIIDRLNRAIVLVGRGASFDPLELMALDLYHEAERARASESALLARAEADARLIEVLAAAASTNFSLTEGYMHTIATLESELARLRDHNQKLNDAICITYAERCRCHECENEQLHSENLIVALHQLAKDEAARQGLAPTQSATPPSREPTQPRRSWRN